MLLTAKLPSKGDNIIAVRGHSVVVGEVVLTDTTFPLVTVRLPGAKEVYTAEIDLWARDGWSWELHDAPREPYAFPVPMPDLSFLDVRTRPVAQ